MDHNQAIDGKFAERYLLGELTPAQRDQFEDHYFDCAVCADDVQFGAVFVDSARVLLRERPVSEEAVDSRRHGAFARYGLPFQSAALAFVALLCVMGYQNVVTIPRLKAHSTGVSAPEVLTAVSLVGIGARAEANPVPAPVAKDFEIEMDIHGGPEFNGYKFEIRDHSGALKFSVPIATAQAQDTVRLAIPARTLEAGAYSIVVLGEKPGGTAQEIDHYPIQLY
jgi:hypothetical protein